MIEGFNFAIGLEMTWRCTVVLDIVLLDECLEFLGSKFFSVVSNDLSGFSISLNDVF